MVPGSNPLHATELFQEGLIIPPVKFMVGGDLNKPVADMIKANVRIPEVVFGDLGAQSAALQVGKRRLLELCEKRSEEHTSELQSLMAHLVCRLLLEKKHNNHKRRHQRNS